ncbi:MAG: hypothetical protein Q8K78_03410 [Planctomycetaceae bacterium]|nr:hypothetical protein [Planctomycetaceae bacterium]
MAAGLGIVLIGGIYAAIEQTWRLNASGKVELERQQIARAILRQITLDIRNTGFTAKPSGETGTETGSTSGTEDGGTGGTETSTTTTTAAGEDEIEWTTSEGIRGTATELSVDLSNPRILSSAMILNGIMPTDLQTVYYTVSSTSGATFDNGADTGVFNRPDTDGLGLVRSIGDRSALRVAGATATGLPGPAKLLAPEIASIQFRYFDGLAWMTEWDTVATGVLPRAIEVTILFEPPPSRGLMTNATVAPGSELYRTVIPVPTSDPVVVEETF